MPRRVHHRTSDVARVRTRAIPHWSVIVLAVSTVALVVVSTLVRDAASSLTWWAVAVVVGGSWWLARRRTRAVAETAANRLDERDLEMRNAAAWWGQAVTLTLGAVAALMLMVLARLNMGTADAVLLRSGGIVLSLMVLSGAVPTIVVSLLFEPEELGDEEDDAHGDVAR